MYLMSPKVNKNVYVQVKHMQLYSTLLTMDNDAINIMSHKKMSEALTIGSQLS